MDTEDKTSVEKIKEFNSKLVSTLERSNELITEALKLHESRKSAITFHESIGMIEVIGFILGEVSDDLGNMRVDLNEHVYTLTSEYLSEV